LHCFILDEEHKETGHTPDCLKEFIEANDKEKAAKPENYNKEKTAEIKEDAIKEA